MTSDIQQAISSLVAGCDLAAKQMDAAMRQIMRGEATAAQIGGFLVALRMKGEKPSEIAAAATVMRDLATPFQSSDKLIDTCGTGGDNSRSFNVSTATAILVAAAGGRVAKHGNRAASSACGSADVLAAAGLELALPPPQAERCLAQLGITFLFAPLYHQAMKHALGPRRELGMRSLFNLLGPLTNPARPAYQLVGVFDRCWQQPLATVLGSLGADSALVVHSQDGLDEISISAPTDCVLWRDNALRSFCLDPRDYGFQLAPAAALQVDSAAQSLQQLQQVLADKPSAARDCVLLNTAATLYTAGLHSDIASALVAAREVLANGSAAALLADWVALSTRLGATQ